MRYPLRIKQSGESFRIEDAAERPLLYIYFEDSEFRRTSIGKRPTREEAERSIKRVARLLTDNPEPTTKEDEMRDAAPKT